MLVSKCCGAPLDPMFPNDTVCDSCKEHCDTYDEEINEDNNKERDQYADSE